MGETWEKYFPNLKPDSWSETSKDSDYYNCIAWAAGDTTRKWWPDHFRQDYWPKEAPRTVAIDSFVKAFEDRGYSICPDDTLEIGFEKVAIYAAQGRIGYVPKHAAWQLDDGTWSSKLGPFKDINHKTLQCLSSKLYGEPVKFLKRRRKSAKAPLP